jgi:hypothetical protein
LVIDTDVQLEYVELNVIYGKMAQSIITDVGVPILVMLDTVVKFGHPSKILLYTPATFVYLLIKVAERSFGIVTEDKLRQFWNACALISVTPVSIKTLVNAVFIVVV